MMDRFEPALAPLVVDRLLLDVGKAIATLALQDPVRINLTCVSDRLLLAIVEALARAELSQEVIAAAFGLTINGYRARLEAAVGRRCGNLGQKTAIERVFEFVASHRCVTWADVARAFPGVKEATLRALLRYLSRAGRIDVRGRGAARVYSARVAVSERRRASP